MWRGGRGGGYQDELRIYRPPNPCLREQLQRGNRRDRRRLRQVFLILSWWKWVELRLYGIENQLSLDPHLTGIHISAGRTASRHEKMFTFHSTPLPWSTMVYRTFIGTRAAACHQRDQFILFFHMKRKMPVM
jgi:hypothetical protein